jgi:hypothetical protein
MAQNRQIRYVRVVSGSMWQYVAGVPGSCRDFAGGCYYRSSRNYLLLRHYLPRLPLLSSLSSLPDHSIQPIRPTMANLTTLPYLTHHASACRT